MQPEFKVSDDPAGVAAELLATTTGHLCITGGSTPRAAYERIAELRAEGVWFTDERCVPPDHEHSNFRMANDALLERAGIPVHRMKGELGPVEGAADYEREYERAGEPVFDLITGTPVGHFMGSRVGQWNGLTRDATLGLLGMGVLPPAMTDAFGQTGDAGLALSPTW